MMAVDDARIVLAEKDWIKYFLPCRPERKHSLKATDETIRFVHLYSTTETSQIFASTFPFPFTQV